MQLQRVRNLTPTDLDTIVKLHILTLEESFINNFGEKFIRIVYKSFLKNKSNIFLVLRDRRKIIGYLVASKGGSLSSSHTVITNFWILIKEITPKILRKPKLALLLLQWFITKFNLLDSPAEIHFLAIDPKYQRKGLGTKLLNKVTEEYEEDGIAEYIVGTKADNPNSNTFYKKSNLILYTKDRFFGDDFNFYSSISYARENVSIYSALRLTSAIVAFFLLIFIVKSNFTMFTTPFYDFDEAHRAENAKQMRLNNSYFVPLTGSGFDRVEHLKIPYKDNPVLHLYYHLERPFLVYLSMIISTSIFGTLLGSIEWAYRLPSFIFGMLIFVLFLFFARQLQKFKPIPFMVALLCLITSSDIWLSSQYAQMDTGITVFLFGSLLFLILYCQTKKNSQIAASGITFALGVLSKGQPAVIFAIPIIYLLIIRKLNLKDLVKFIFFSAILLIPWLFYLSIKFGLADVIKIMSGFAISSASIIYKFNEAPFFWYGRWWLESFRPGWVLFLSLVTIDFLNLKIDWKKGVLLSYIFGGFLAFSVPPNKIWWYVLPLIPAVGFYIYISSSDYLKTNLYRIYNLSTVLVLASLPIFLRTSNTLSLLYGITLVLISIFILRIELPFKKIFQNYYAISLATVFTFSLVVFYSNFPQITPWHRSTKPAALFYKSLPGTKCLWVYDMPAEAVLFYSDAGVVEVYNEGSKLYGHCKHYLMTPSYFKNGTLIYKRGQMQLFELPTTY